MTAQVLCRDRALGVHAPLIKLLDLWVVLGTHDILVAPEGGYRFGFSAEQRQAELFRTLLSRAPTLRETPHGRRCALDIWPVGFAANRDFDHQPLPGMLDKFRAWGVFVDKHGPALGLRWGGHFAGFGLFGDMPHVELIGWQALYQFPGGEPVVAPS